MSESKIEACKRIVLWMLKDKPHTTHKIVSSFTIFEKKQRIRKAIEELTKEGKIINIETDPRKIELWRLNNV